MKISELWRELLMIQYHIENHIARIALNRADHHNALSPDMMNQLMRALEDAIQNHNAHSIILYTRHKNFCTGADLNHMLKMGKTDWEENLSDAKKFVTLFSTLYHCEKPTICCVQGKTMGGGLGLMAACDIVIAASDATFCFSEVKLGLIPATISPFVLRRISYSHAKKLMLTAEIWNTQTAKQIGLIDEIADPAFEKGLLIAAQLQKNNFNAMRELKKWLKEIAPIENPILQNAAKKLAEIRSAPETQRRIENFLKSRDQKSEPRA